MTPRQEALEWINAQIARAKELGIEHVSVYETIKAALSVPESVRGDAAKDFEHLVKSFDMDEKFWAERLSNIRAALATVGWKDISTAPKDGTEILVFDDGDIWIARYKNGKWYESKTYCIGGPNTELKPTQWQSTSPPEPMISAVNSEEG